MSMSLKAIPLCQLQRSKINVRKTDKAADIEQLAASIEAHGLLENLVVTPLDDAKGADALYDVLAGGRRHAALKLLAKRKKIAADYPVPYQLRKGVDVNLTELSLAENIERAPLHPADQFKAFAKLHMDGLSADDIAVRFGLTPTLVAQRLKLAAVSPRLMATYRKAELTLEQLMAFAISDDHRAQEELWFDLPYADHSPYGIRRHLTKAHIDGTDRRARFIGAKAYEEAGGVIIRDLFAAEDEGYFADGQLLDRLVGEKLKAQATDIRTEGWKWVEIATQPDGARTAGFSRARKIEVALSTKEEKRLTRLAARYDTLIAELEENDDESSEELDRVSQELSVLQAKRETWPDSEIAGAGVLVCLDHDGSIAVIRGLVRPEDRDRDEEGAAQTQSSRSRDAYSDALLLDLSAHRTAAIREVLAQRPEQAQTALLHALTMAIFFDGPRQGCIAIKPFVAELHHASKSVAESRAAVSFGERHARWQERFSDADALWDQLESLDSIERLSLLAHCVGATVNGLWQRNDCDGRRAATDWLTQRLGLDMAAWWRPTRMNFLKFITKTQILQTVSQALPMFDTKRLATLKKDELADRVEGLLAETRWLPQPLQNGVAYPGQDT